jgi:hypothetical protein
VKNRTPPLPPTHPTALLLQASRAAESMLLRSLLGPPIRAALQAAHAAQTAAGDLMLMIVMVPAPAQPSGLDVRVHVHPYSSSTQAGSAVILGGPRSVPIGKVRC